MPQMTNVLLTAPPICARSFAQPRPHQGSVGIVFMAFSEGNYFCVIILSIFECYYFIWLGACYGLWTLRISSSHFCVHYSSQTCLLQTS